MKFTGHIEITDLKKETGFEQYLLLQTDYDYYQAFGLDDDTPLDIDMLLREIYPEDKVCTEPSMCGPHNARIITDGRLPNSPVVWESKDFYFILTDQ